MAPILLGGREAVGKIKHYSGNIKDLAFKLGNCPVQNENKELHFLPE
jgi:hypothetical protein